MLTAAALFGVLVSELQELLAALNEGGCALDDYIEGLTSFLNHNSVSRAMHRSLSTKVMMVT